MLSYYETDYVNEHDLELLIICQENNINSAMDITSFPEA